MTNTTNANTPATTQDSTSTTTPSHHNPLNKVVGAIKNSLHGKKEEPSPALQEAIQKMEERKANKVAEMQAEGKDTRALSGRRRDQVETSPGEGAVGVVGSFAQFAG